METFVQKELKRYRDKTNNLLFPTLIQTISIPIQIAQLIQTNPTNTNYNNTNTN